MEGVFEDEASLIGQAQVWQLMFAFADSMALKCAVELHIPDIIHSHGKSITLSQIASSIDSTSPDIPYLQRIMRLLVRRNIFTADHPSDGGETLYGLTHVSKWLVHDSDRTLAPMVLMENHPWTINPWHCFSQCVKKGGIAFEKANGHEIWDFAARNPEFNKMFNGGMSCTARLTIRAILEGYKDGFCSMKSLVDVGGGTGDLVTEIVKSHPHIKGINYDLAHVVSTAPAYEGVCHVGGDMFQAIPNADAVIMKWIMHDWGDEDCVRILKNCRKAIPEKTGKVMIVDIVLQPEGNGLFDDTRLVFDLLMIAHSSGGKERTEAEWKKILEEGGFPRYRIIKIPALTSIIEAYPE
ncbi:xanthohumol 4-O-methyltransferase [Ricinus communis]|uniref:O-methyltransferase, putative n=1 Tax=Ricinus communis TaxID=3988 RepID=B9RW38_RICCO|nr:xanthohumol 4-O-methyltransferase [Ricinus communis]EEF44475.1 o-methyltransferase, putative [Ricinus communis]|eukprot:XP_002517957.1 xanthohumol 4-O-methyltransferase [Ricinus communis]